MCVDDQTRTSQPVADDSFAIPRKKAVWWEDALLTHQDATPAADLHTASAADLPTYVSALLYPQGWRWNADFAPGTATTVTYSWKTGNDTGYSGFRAFNDTEKAAAREAMSEWSKVTNVTFTEVASGGQMEFANASLGGATGYTSWGGTSGKYSGYKITHADVLMNGSAGLTYADGDGGMRTMLHEIGHALGLKHTFDTSGPTLSGVENTAQYSVMSYDNSPQTPNVQPSTPQLYDIAAVQYLYGADTSTATGNDVYQWSNSRTTVATVWDGGGTDTLSAANQSIGAVLDLRAGQFSDVGPYGGAPARDNIAIAFGTVIENATGGSGNDILIGNSAANVLTGGGGADQLTGGSGVDTFLWRSAAEGGDTVTDFVSGTDLLQFDQSAFGTSGFVRLGSTYTGGNGSGADWSAGKAVFVFDSSGTLYWDSNGSAAGYSKIALVKGGAVAASDIHVGDSQPTSSPTPATTDPAPQAGTIVGTGGADSLSGVGGDFTMKGGLGNDTYIVDSAGDSVVEYGGEGVDTVRSTLSMSLGSYVENLVLTGSGGTNGTGSSWHNLITGNDAGNRLAGLAGNDALKGMGGSDVLTGGSGRDALTGGSGADTFRFNVSSDGGYVATNSTRGGVAGDSVLDFTAGSDRISLDDAGFGLAMGQAVSGGNFARIGTAYNGLNGAGADYLSGRAALIADTTGTLYYDANGKGAGYTVLATLQPGVNVHASDVIIA